MKPILPPFSSHLLSIRLDMALLAVMFLVHSAAAQEKSSLKVSEPQVLYKADLKEYQVIRIPALIAEKDGTLLAFCEGRVGGRADDAQTRILLRRSTDDGKTWSEPAVIHAEGEKTIGNPSPVLDAETGIIWLFLSRNNNEVLVISSKDSGLTWSEPVDMTAQLKRPEQSGFYATGPGHGIQLTKGAHKGRLLVPAYAYQDTSAFQRGSKSFVIYSDDQGKTWQIGGTTQEEFPEGPDGNECMIVETDDDSLYMTIRNNTAKGGRASATSTDGGTTWSKVKMDPNIPEPVCQGSVLGYKTPGGREVALYVAPSVTATNRKDKTARQKLALWTSEDRGATWQMQGIIYEGLAAYSDMAVLQDGSVGVLFDADYFKGDRTLFVRCEIPSLKK